MSDAVRKCPAACGRLEYRIDSRRWLVSLKVPDNLHISTHRIRWEDRLLIFLL